MAGLNLLTKLYLIFVAFLGLVTMFACFQLGTNWSGLWWEIILLFLVATLAEGYQLTLNRGYVVSAHPALHIGIIFLLPPAAVVLVVFLSISLEQIAISRVAGYKRLFNIAHHVIISGVPAIVLGLTTSRVDLQLSLSEPKYLLLLPITLLLYYLLDVGLVDLAIMFSTGESLFELWKTVNKKTLIFDLSLASMGLIFALVWAQTPFFCVLLILPLAVNRFAQRSLSQTENETKQAIISIARVVESRDPYTYGHSERVGSYCRQICLELSLSEEETELITLSGQVHDLGKIGIRDEVLRKPGKLTDEEWEEMRKHPVTGAEILKSYSFFKAGVLYVRHHHESWNGKGYPDGLADQEIPLGARIIAVADSFDAMTTDRPYRRGMQVEKAITILEEGGGVQWDAEVVMAFLKIVRRSMPPVYLQTAATTPERMSA